MIQRIRQDTDLVPGLIHFNNAGGSLPTKAVTKAITNYLAEEARMGAYETADRHAEALDGFYRELASYLNARADQIAFSISATEAFNRGLLSINWQAGDIVLTTKSDYVSNQLLFMRLRDRYGVVTEILPEGKEGYDPEGFAERLANGPLPRLVSITHVPTNSGRIQDIEYAGRLCRKYEILYAVDACQSAGQLPLDVGAIGCDFLTATFRKYLRGPRGTGFLYLSDRVLKSDLCPLGLDGRGAVWTGPQTYRSLPDARRFETWEESKALKLGAATATAYLNELGIATIQGRIAALSTYLTTALSRLPALIQHPRQLVTPEQSSSILPSVGTAPAEVLSWQTGIHLMSVPGWTDGPASLISVLRKKGLNVTTSGVSHDQYHFREKGIDWALRLSIHYFNTEEEIDLAMNILADVLPTKT